VFWTATLFHRNNANYLIHQRNLQIYRWCIHFSIGTDGNLYLPMVNWLTICTDEQCFGGLPYAIAILLTTSFTNRLYKFTDGAFISPSVPRDNLYLPMANQLTIGTSEHSLFTDGIFIFPAVWMDIDGRYNFTKLTISMLATVLDNSLVWTNFF
jgi:hypothetical protein